MKRRLLVTGYGGFVAGSVVRQAGCEWEVEVFSRSRPAEVRDGFRCRQFDLCNAAQLQANFSEAKPDVVVHTAALANIDTCQTHQREAEQVNVDVTCELAQLCNECGAKLIFCSTDAVFDGTRGNYSETDPPRAVNYYAETKIRAEQAVEKYAGSNVVARLALVVGLPVLDAGNSFVTKMRSALQAGQEMYCPANEIRTPIDVDTLGRALLELAANDFTGTLHLAGDTRTNRYELACQLAEHLGYPSDLIVATDSNALADRTPRPGDVSLDNSKARAVLQTPLLPWLEGFALSQTL